MQQYVVKVKKHGKWKFYSDHDGLEYAEVNADVQENSGLEVKIEYKGKVMNRKPSHNNN